MGGTMKKRGTRTKQIYIRDGATWWWRDFWISLKLQISMTLRNLLNNPMKHMHVFCIKLFEYILCWLLFKTSRIPYFWCTKTSEFWHGWYDYHGNLCNLSILNRNSLRRKDKSIVYDDAHERSSEDVNGDVHFALI